MIDHSVLPGGHDGLPELPERGPFRLRGRVITPLSAGGSRHLDDGLLAVDDAGRIAAVGPWPGTTHGELPDAAPVVDVRPWLVMPGLVDLHTHLPQFPNAGVGAGLDLLTWLNRYTLPLEGTLDRRAAAAQAPAVFAALAGAGTTTVAAYVTTEPDATDAVFEAAETHGMRAIVGLVLMDRPVQGGPTADATSMAEALDASAELCRRWHGRDAGRLLYAFTPRFAVSCSATLLRESARLAREAGAYWQTHLSEDRRELAEVAEAFPEARDYLDVYDRAGALGLGPRALFAHAIYLSDREVSRLATSGAAVAHCPASNLFLPSGVMPLARYLEAGVRIGLGSDVSGGPSPSIFETMRVGAYAHHALQTAGATAAPGPGPLEWLRLGTLGGARALGIDDRTGSLEAGKEADLIVVDPALTEPIPGAAVSDGPDEIVSRLIFRTHPDMVRLAWVRGRRLAASAPGQGCGANAASGRR